MALIVVALIVVSVLVAASLSILKNDFSSLGVVWGIVGPIAGAVVGYYFRQDRRE